MEEHSEINHLTVCKNIDLLHMKSFSTIGRGNWITGFPSGDFEDFGHELNRSPILKMGKHSAITHRHLIDCTNTITLGDFSVIAGFQSQLLSHSVDLEKNRQSSAPIEIGNYCFIGTNCILLGNTSLPDYSVLSAKSLLNKKFSENYHLYGGVPANPLKVLSRELLYFSRLE